MEADPLLYYLAALQCKPHPTMHLSWYLGVVLMLRVCDGVEQLWVYGEETPTGFVAWLRCEHAHLEVFRSRQIDPILTLPTSELQTGEVLYIAEMVAPPTLSAFWIIRDLIRKLDVRYLAGWRGGRFRVHHVHRKEVSNGIRDELK